MSDTDIHERLMKLGSDYHKMSEKLAEHIASETGCRDTVQALARCVWGNGKPGIESNLSDVKTDVAVIRTDVETIKNQSASDKSMRNQIWAGAAIAVLAAVLGAIF